MTFKIGDKVRYNKDAEVYGWSEKGAVFKVTARVDGDAYCLEGDPDEVHDSWLEKVEEEYGVGDIVCARKGKEIIQGELVKKTDGELGLSVLWPYMPSPEKLKEEAYSIQLVEKAKPVEPESDYAVFLRDECDPVFAFRNENGDWVAENSEYVWEDLFAERGPNYVELVEK